MLSTTEKELARKIRSAEIEIKRLRGTLNQLGKEKEDLFLHQKQLLKQIKDLLEENKSLRERRNNLTDEARKAKAERQRFNEQIKVERIALKKLKEEKKEAMKRLGIKNDPELIKKKIENLEFFIETEALPFEKEKQLMKRLNKLKKDLAEAQKLGSVLEKSSQIIKKIEELRRAADSKHAEALQKANLSQEMHNRILENKHRIDNEFRVKLDELGKAIAQKKALIEQTSKELEEKLKELGYLSAKRQAKLNDEIRRNKEIIMQKLARRREDVHQKLVRGEKLTTEDILALQAEES